MVYLPRNNFDYTEGNEGKHIDCKKSGNRNLKTERPVSGG